MVVVFSHVYRFFTFPFLSSSLFVVIIVVVVVVCSMAMSSRIYVRCSRFSSSHCLHVWPSQDARISDTLDDFLLFLLLLLLLLLSLHLPSHLNV